MKLDSISFPLCSDYTCIRKPVSLPVQLEIGRIQKIKLAKNCPILGIILHFREVAWLSHCLSFRFSFHSWDQLFTGHISTGPLMALLHKLNARIFHICVCVCVCMYSEKAMAPHSSTLAWKIPWMEEPGRLCSMGLLRVGHD